MLGNGLGDTNIARLFYAISTQLLEDASLLFP